MTKCARTNVTDRSNETDLRIARGLRRDWSMVEKACAERPERLELCHRFVERTLERALERTLPDNSAADLLPRFCLMVSAVGLLVLAAVSGADEVPFSSSNSSLNSLAARTVDTDQPPLRLATPEAIGAHFAIDLSAALEAARAYHSRNVVDYRCKLVRQEVLNGQSHAEQEIEVLFRQRPFSVVMHWVRNMARVERAIYVEGRWRDQDASSPDQRELAMFQPSGGVARLFAKSVFRPIRCDEVRAAARRTLDQFGFERGLVSLVDSARQPQTMVFAGSSSALGRPTWLIKRQRPFWCSDRRQLMERGDFHIDQQLLVPIAVTLYEGEASSRVVGRYEFHNIRMNSGLSESDFEPRTYGM